MGSLISKMKVKREKRELIIKMHFTYFIDDPFFFCHCHSNMLSPPLCPSLCSTALNCDRQPSNQQHQLFTSQLNFPPLAAHWVAAHAGEVLEAGAGDVVIANLELCGVGADLVSCPVGDSLAAFGPGHHSLRRGLADAVDSDCYFFVSVDCGFHRWLELDWTTWGGDEALLWLIKSLIIHTDGDIPADRHYQTLVTKTCTGGRTYIHIYVWL